MKFQKTKKIILLSIYVTLSLCYWSCDGDDSTAINYAKRVLVQIEPESEKVSVDVACDILVNTFDGNVTWEILNLKDLDEYTRKVLIREHPKSKFVTVLLLNKFNVTYGYIVFAVNTKTAQVNFVQSALGETIVKNVLQLDYAIISELESFEERKSYLNYYKYLKPEEIIEFKPGDNCIVITQILNIRKSPSQYGEKIGELNKGTHVKILQVANSEWVKIQSNDHQGFVASKYLQKVE